MSAMMVRDPVDQAAVAVAYLQLAPVSAEPGPARSRARAALAAHDRRLVRPVLVPLLWDGDQA